jgi:hypothetical protein
VRTCYRFFPTPTARTPAPQTLLLQPVPPPFWVRRPDLGARPARWLQVECGRDVGPRAHHAAWSAAHVHALRRGALHCESIPPRELVAHFSRLAEEHTAQYLSPPLRRFTTRSRTASGPLPASSSMRPTRPTCVYPSRRACVAPLSAMWPRPFICAALPTGRGAPLPGHTHLLLNDATLVWLTFGRPVARPLRS